jgi:membrane-associated phospholipid phosphatase
MQALFPIEDRGYCRSMTIRPVRDALRTGDAEEIRDDTNVGTVDLTHWYTPIGRTAASLVRRVGTYFGDRVALLLILVVGAVVAFGLSFVASRIYDSITESDGVAGLDRPVLDAAMQLRTPALDAIAAAIAYVAGPIGMPILAALAIVILALRRKSWTPVILIAAAGAGSVLMTIAGKDIVGRVRPPHADAVPPFEFSPSFPSGHTLNAIVIAGVVCYLLILRQRSTHARAITIVVASVVALTVGLSRVYLGAHWFTDVLAGWALGGAWLALVITAHRLYVTSRQAHIATAPMEAHNGETTEEPETPIEGGVRS